MTQQEKALVHLARLLSSAEVPYMVIGGLANAIWGQSRATLDIDITIWSPEANAERLMAILAPHFTPLVSDPREFVARTRVLPVQNQYGIKADLIFGGFSFEEEAIRRAKSIRVQKAEIRFCTAEDLILQKIISDRERDKSDVQGVLAARLPQLDLGYLEPRIIELSNMLDRPEIWERWEKWKRDVKT